MHRDRREDAIRFGATRRIALGVFVIAWFVSAAPALSASDPTVAFITLADSISRSETPGALDSLVSQNRELLSAGVGVLLDAAIDAGDGGDHAAERENFDFAERLGLVYHSLTGSDAPTRLVRTYRAWTSKERAARRHAKDLEAQSAEARDAGDTQRAAELLVDAEAEYESIGDDRSVAVVWGSLGVVHWRAGNFDAATESYEKALEARRRIEDRILEGRTLNGLGSAWYQKGEFTRASDYYAQAVTLRRKTGDLGGLATSLTYLGNAYAQLGRLIDARESYEEAYKVVEVEGTSAQRIELLNSIANLNSDMGRLQSANDAYERALAIAQSNGDLVKEMICRNNIALNLASEFRYSQALEELNAVQGLLAQNPDPEQSLTFHRNSGIIYLNMGELELARDHFLIFLKASEDSGLPLNQVEALLNLGYLVEQLGDYDRGLSYAKRAAAIALEAGQPRMIREATILTAQLYWQMGRSDDAIKSWEDALKSDTENGAELDIASDRIGIANVYATAGKSEEARKAFEGIRSRVEETGDGDLMLALYFGLGHAFEQADPESSRCYYERALSMIEKTRAAIGGAEVRTGYLGGVRRYYYEEVARYYAAQAKKGAQWSSLAFITIERAKARGLLDLIESAVADNESGAEAAVLDSLYSVSPESTDYASIKKSLTDRYLELRNRRIGGSLGGFVHSHVVSLDEVRKSLPKGTVLLSYALGDSASLMWAIDRDGHDLYELPGRGALRNDVERLRDAISRPGAGDVALRTSARRLYEILIAPAEKRLDRNRRLVVVPDGFLFEMPFEVLLSRDVDQNAPWSKLPFLARKFAPVYAPSSSVYLSLRDSKKPERFDLEVLALGDPEFGPTGDDKNVRGAGLDRLPATRNEVLGITESLGSDRKLVLLGADANEAALKKCIRDKSPRILHLATHGLVDPLEPAASSIALSKSSASNEDGYLHTLEILSLPLKSELVVLSACESARGKVSRGEGVVGLSRAFIACGARGTIASLWAVSDESTSILMKDLYARMLKDKKTAGDALNEARLDLMNSPEYSHPYYWSPFVVVGSDRSPW